MSFSQFYRGESIGTKKSNVSVFSLLFRYWFLKLNAVTVPSLKIVTALQKVTTPVTVINNPTTRLTIFTPNKLAPQSSSILFAQNKKHKNDEPLQRVEDAK